MDRASLELEGGNYCHLVIAVFVFAATVRLYF